ncbi:MAG: DUF3263 domain-containing protein [Nonomuraea sp.]|nr:DUF3263 domain-containing protein [Nonomuraea sp.]NUQ33268.1 DUF3263 domain-containing protein [Dermatophilaceae bacterium]NUR81086.1 DUF3263 domain-containing protein [Dermatophilaceae bacterium]
MPADLLADLLEFERAWLNDPRAGDGRKAQAIRETFGVNETRHYQRVVAAVTSREAWETDPVTTRALSEQLQARSRQRQ